MKSRTTNTLFPFLFALLFLFVLVATISGKSSRPNRYRVYVGTVTEDPDEGIYSFLFSPDTGALDFKSVTTGLLNPGFLALSPGKEFLYAVNEVQKVDGQSTGAVSAYKRDKKNGDLTFLNHQSSYGQVPVYISVFPDGNWVFVANYITGNVAVFPVLDDGRLGDVSDVVQYKGSSIHPGRQN